MLVVLCIVCTLLPTQRFRNDPEGMFLNVCGSGTMCNQLHNTTSPPLSLSPLIPAANPVGRASANPQERAQVATANPLGGRALVRWGRLPMLTLSEGRANKVCVGNENDKTLKMIYLEEKATPFLEEHGANATQPQQNRKEAHDTQPSENQFWPHIRVGKVILAKSQTRKVSKFHHVSHATKKPKTPGTPPNATSLTKSTRPRRCGKIGRQMSKNTS